MFELIIILCVFNVLFALLSIFLLWKIYQNEIYDFNVFLDFPTFYNDGSNRTEVIPICVAKIKTIIEVEENETFLVTRRDFKYRGYSVALSFEDTKKKLNSVHWGRKYV